MTAERRCVDYLSHEWHPSDLITTHREIQRQAHQPNPKEVYRLARFQNALWRQMARTLTTRLGKSNPMVDPATVDWQKESDVTWLYGPIYHEKGHQEVAIVDLPFLDEQRQRVHDDAEENRRRHQQQQKNHHSTNTCRRVRFNPEIIEYDAPRIPDDPSVVESVVTGLTSRFKTYLLIPSAEKQMALFLRKQQPMAAELSIFCAAAAFLKSFTSVMATWILYRGLGRLMRRTWRIRQQRIATGHPV